MHPQQQREIWLLITVIVISAIIGGIIGYPFAAVALVLLIYIFYTQRNLLRLHSWLLKRKKGHLPEVQGFWGELFNEIYVLEKDARRNKASLKDTIIRFQQAAKAIPDGMIILNKRSQIDWANYAALTLLGVNYPDDSGQPISNLIRSPQFLAYLNNKDFTHALTIPSPEHPTKTITIRIIPYVKSQKLIICRDVTHVAKLEDMRSHFVANASHELRSPITVLSGFLETMLESPPGPDKLKPALQTMYEQAKRMERLVADLLALSRLETKPTDQHDEVIDVVAMLGSIKEAADLLSSNQHTITLHINTDIQLKGNHDELHSLFSNLVNNAVRYTHKDGQIDIYWRISDNEAEFCVSDNGPGIARQHLSHLTERFYRVDIDRSRESGGTGLGLAIVKHVLERHEGKLSIESELNKGSTFCCTFPPQRTVKQAVSA